jgi:hypothetical protein
MQDAAGVLSSMASSLGSWSEVLATFQKDHPELAKGVAVGAVGAGVVGGGALTVSLMTGLMTGFGLPAASVELPTSAAALTAAAAELSGAAVVQKGGTAAAAAAGGFGSKIWGAGAAALPFLGAAGLGAGAYYLAESANERQGLTKEAHRARVNRLASKNNWFNWWGNDADAGGPTVTDTMTYGTGVGGDRSLTATLTGSADVKGEVTGRFEVVPGSALMSLVESVQQMKIGLSGTLNANGPGSLGHSSPDAAAPAPKPSTGGASGAW